MPSQPIYTLGVEEEYQILDPLSRDLSSSATHLLQEAQQTLGDAVQYEMLLSQIETVTPVCHTLTEVRAALIHLRSNLIAAANRCDVQIAAAATHPFSRWQDQQFSPGERYHSIQQNYRQLAYEQSIWGCHVHVGLDNREEAVQVMNHARVWLAPLLALTGNSPYFGGYDTGYASYRTEIWARWPFLVHRNSSRRSRNTMHWYKRLPFRVVWITHAKSIGICACRHASTLSKSASLTYASR